MEGQAAMGLVIGTVVVLFVPGLVWVTVTAGMGEVFRWAGGVLRVVMAMIIMLTPGIVFWLVVIGVMVILRRLSRTDLYQRVAVQDSGKPGPSHPERGSVGGTK